MQLSWAILATVVVHGGFAVYVSGLPDKPPPRERTVITIRETKKPRPLPPAPPPPPPPVEVAPELPKPAPPKPAPAPKPAAPPPKVAPPPPSVATPAPPAGPVATDLRLGNGPGGSGPAIAAPPSGPATPTDAPKPAAPKPKTLEAKPAAEDGCADPLVKPKPLDVVQPAFTQEARDAGVTGKVRVEITISATGSVTAAKVIAGLGHGLDEAALEAAKASTFSPATRCGVAVETTFTIGMRFQ